MENLVNHYKPSAGTIRLARSYAKALNKYKRIETIIRTYQKHELATFMWTNEKEVEIYSSMLNVEVPVSTILFPEHIPFLSDENQKIINQLTYNFAKQNNIQVVSVGECPVEKFRKILDHLEIKLIQRIVAEVDNQNILNTSLLRLIGPDVQTRFVEIMRDHVLRQVKLDTQPPTLSDRPAEIIQIIDKAA